MHPDDLNAVTGHDTLLWPRAFMTEYAITSDPVILADVRMREHRSAENADGLTSKTMLNS